MDIEFKVCVNSITYNHSPYIKDTMDGFCIQETGFPFVCTIVDDASTDAEPEVIRNYLTEHFDLNDHTIVRNEETDDYVFIFARHKTNRNCFFAVYFLKYNHFQVNKPSSPYVSDWRDRALFFAQCEGDDYWTDPHKLQIQVEYLENHPEYLFCCHRYKIFEQNTGRFLKEYGYDYYQDGSDLVIDEELFLKVWVTQTLTAMMRMVTWKEVLSARKAYSNPRDVHTYYLLLKQGKGVSLNRCMGVYRWHNGGIAIGQTYFRRYETGFNLYNELLIKNPDDELLKPKVLYYGIRFLRVSGYGKDSFSLMKYLLSLIGSPKVRAAIVASFFIPSKLYNLAAKAYSKERLNKLGVE